MIILSKSRMAFFALIKIIFKKKFTKEIYRIIIDRIYRKVITIPFLILTALAKDLAYERNAITKILIHSLIVR